MIQNRSQQLYAQACNLIPGGVNSPVRAFQAVGGTPFFIAKGEGAYLIDVDGNRFIDYVCSWGPLILGHAHPEVVEVASQVLRLGSSFGAPSPWEVDLAQLIVEGVPSVEMVRMVNSGTEAVMSAVRLARAYTNRDLVVKFAGGYHGHSDGLIVQGGSGIATLGITTRPGIPQAIAEMTLTLPYNDLEAVERAFQLYGERIAAVIVEPIAGNMGVVPPKPGFLEGLRRLTKGSGSLLIFDEVITGFRVSYGGAQALYGVLPDLTCLGKIIGGGFPVGAFGGPREIMKLVAPLGPVYQAGTLSGNPVAMACGATTLRILRTTDPYGRLEKLGVRLAEGLREAAREAGIPVTVNRVGSMLTVFFTEGPVENFDDANRSDKQQFSRFFWGMLERGVYIPPSQFEAWFVSLSHSEKEIERTVEAAREVFRHLR
ncbi:MAG: glutamate-1-semialdehyde 2,1-aminomutase [Armatimonadota bacterium]|nr:glutamate-1-semialdehyde 2,1-aminomutase [Armatimonadota bacterium]